MPLSRSRGLVRHLPSILVALSLLAIGFTGPNHAQSGVRGQYFNSSIPPLPGDFSDFERTDPQVNFFWPGDAPDGTPINADDRYSARWTGSVLIEEPGDWTFTTSSNDGVRMWFDNALIIDNFTIHPVTDDLASVTVESPGWYPIRIDYFNDGGTGTMRLYFEGPGQPRVVVPSTHLCDSSTCGQTLVVDAGPDIFTVPAQGPLVLRGRADLGGRNEATQELPPFARWSQLEGPPVDLETPNRLNTRVLGARPGIYKFRFEVRNGSGQSGSDELIAYVIDQNEIVPYEERVKKWDTVTLSFTHDQVLNEASSSPNPFLDLRLQVFFHHPDSGTTVQVPGYFAADGNAAETSSTAGDQWRVHFPPPRSGEWYYMADFRSGDDISVETDPFLGTPESFSGACGFFMVDPVPPGAPGLLAQGELRYLGDHFLGYAETLTPYIKGGSNSPENFLGYYEFDGTFDLGGDPNDLDNSVYGDGLHHYDPHLDDYEDLGIPLWQGDKGRRIFGSINYLAEKGVNALYFLTYNLDGGDGQEVWPWRTPVDRTHFDVSKLEQWCRVFDHMTRAGVVLHVLTQETENDFALDDGNLGLTRKLYYRELIARFGHSLGLIWNLGEENDNGAVQVRQFIDFIKAHDPYDHPISVLPRENQNNQILDPLLGGYLEMVSLQSIPQTVGNTTASWVNNSDLSDRPWVICYDEQAPPNDGVVPDAVDFDHDLIRKQALWGNLMSKGAGVEWYFGYAHPDSDLDCEDFRSRDRMWELTTIARRFFEDEVPVLDLVLADHVSPTPGVRVLANFGEIYLAYLPNGGTAEIFTGDNMTVYDIGWFDPQVGGDLQVGTLPQVTATGTVSIGNPPYPGDDWAVVMRRANDQTPIITGVITDPSPFVPGSPLRSRVCIYDANGPGDIDRVNVFLLTPMFQLVGVVQAQRDSSNCWSIYADQLGRLMPGTWRLYVQVVDKDGREATRIETLPVR